MGKRKYYVGSLATLTIVILILSHAVATQNISNTPESHSNQILFSRLDSAYSGSTYVLDVTTREVTRLTPTWHLPTSWSPDGSRILAYHPNVNPFIPSVLVMFDTNGQNRLELTDNTQIDPYLGQWTPDGNGIVFWGRDLQVERGQPSWSIYDMPSNGGSTRRLTQPTSSPGRLTISPDGSQIVFTQDGTLYTMPSGGGEPHELGVQIRIRATLTWSPDGSQLTTLALSNSGWLGIYVFAPDGSNVRLLVSNMGDINNVRWSPDSSELLFIANARTNAEKLGIVNVQTNVVNTYQVGEGVLESLSGIGSATWSPDGTQIAISGRYRENNPYDTHTSLYVVDHDLTQIERLTHEQTIEGVVQWRSD